MPVCCAVTYLGLCVRAGVSYPHHAWDLLVLPLTACPLLGQSGCCPAKHLPRLPLCPAAAQTDPGAGPPCRVVAPHAYPQAAAARRVGAADLQTHTEAVCGRMVCHDACLLDCFRTSCGGGDEAAGEVISHTCCMVTCLTAADV